MWRHVENITISVALTLERGSVRIVALKMAQTPVVAQT
jgi:hypothetical protein